MKTVVVLGGDGFCGWPSALWLSECGYRVVIVDNLIRRKTDVELDAFSLTPISSIHDRIEGWKDVSGKTIEFVELNVAEEYDRLLALLTKLSPTAVIHFAEQRAAPYSMKSSAHKRYTVNNNINATNNVLCALVEAGLKDTHLVHLGTMGVYGYGATRGATIPEGYLTVETEVAGVRVKQNILHPTDPGSIYHTTKVLDQSLFYFFNKNDGLMITDLHQGIVWGTNTDLTKRDPRLMNRFDYDGDYGTVLNRFLMQAAIGHPLTVHGSGGQTRAFIHISDSARAIERAVAQPPEPGSRVRILNQMTETRRVIDLAKMVSEMTGVPIENLENPRKEAVENDLVVDNNCFIRLGIEPVKLAQGLFEEVMEIAKKYSDRCDTRRIRATSKWVKN